MAKILIADDDRGGRRFISLLLCDMGYSVVESENAHQTLEKLRSSHFDLLILDMRMPEKRGGPQIPEMGLRILKKITDSDLDLDIIVITAYGEVENAVAAMKLGAKDYLEKPIDDDEFTLRVKRLLEHRELVSAHRQLSSNHEALVNQVQKPYQFENIVGESPQMRKLFEDIRKAAVSSATVIITGESGTGKELVAKALHYHSPRRSAPVVTLNCAGLARELTEAELFGYRKGSFTGAMEDRAGAIEAANRGTVFLDEIGDLPLEVQPKLLRVLEQKELRRIGEPFPRQIDVRFVAATNRALEDMVRTQQFRADLFERLNVVPLHLPSLRERKTDIPLLVEHFIHQLMQETGRRITGIEPEALEIMQQYSWPRNVRELRNVIERAIIFMDGARITPKDIHLTSIPSSNEGFQIPIGASMEDIKREAIRQTLDAVNGNRAEAARRLGISQSTVFDTLKKMRET
jgi:DNA-binding NtrC family response regulator